jgi:RimJ/RimL family protein N-acetyltransferase
VYRYLGDGRPRSTEFHRVWLERTIAQHDEGLGQRVVLRDGRAIGRCGIGRYFREHDRDGARLSAAREAPSWSPFLEMGWTFEREAWGHGYATEAAEALLEGFVPREDEPLYAMIHEDNARSIRVAERRGWAPRQRARMFDRPMVLYGP